MTMTPIITIAIPVYNVERYVEKSLLSALNQDFSKPYEILIVDDCGIDNSMAIVQDVIRKHSRANIVRIIKHPQNKGLGEARNTAVDNACGKYLFFLDSDDWMESDALSTLYPIAEDTSADYVVGSINTFVEATGENSLTVFPDKIIEHPSAGVYMNTHHINMNIHLWNKLWRMSFVRKNDLRCVHRIIEDGMWDFNARVLANKIVLCSKVTINYNMRENSIMSNIQNKKGTDESAFVFTDIVRQMRQQIQEKYYNVPDIYDLYYTRVCSSLGSLKQSTYTPAQLEFINTQIKGYNRVAPSFWKLKNQQSRYLYVTCYNDDSYERFVKVNEFLNTIVGRILRKILYYI